MGDQILGALLGGVRLVLVVVALVVALLPIGRSAISGFCPEPTTDEAVGEIVVAAGTTVTLATTAEPSEGLPSQDPAEPLPSEGGSLPPSTEPSAPADEGSSGDDAAEQPCGAGVDRCLPPLVSGIFAFGDPACGDQATDLLRSRMLPAFGIASLLLGTAWALRPRDGAPILSRR